MNFIKPGVPGLPLVFKYLFIIVALYCLTASVTRADDKTYVYAASSMTGVVNAIAAHFQSVTGKQVVPVFGASSTLARQIANGAPANLFISANPMWMDMLVKKGMVEPNTRRDIARNRLVIASSSSNPATLAGFDAKEIIKRLNSARFAIADPTHVPAGVYAKQAMQSLKLWEPLEARLAIASNVRVAVAYIERGETPLGIVYASELIGRKNIAQVAQIPETTHDPVRYPMAIVHGKQTPDTRAFVQTLQSDKGQAILSQFGFQPL